MGCGGSKAAKAGAPPASAPPGEDGHEDGRPRADSENVLDSANSPPITLNDGRLMPPTASAAQVATLTSFELAPLAGSVLGSIIYQRAQQTAFPQDDGTFRAPAEALIALFDVNNDGWLSLQEAKDAILTFATATHPLDPTGRGVTIDDLVTVANNLSKSLLSVSVPGANKVSADDIEVWLESELGVVRGAAPQHPEAHPICRVQSLVYPPDAAPLLTPPPPHPTPR